LQYIVGFFVFFIVLALIIWILKWALIILGIFGAIVLVVFGIRRYLKKRNDSVLHYRQQEKAVLNLASKNGGYLTAIDLSVKLDIPLEESEKLLEHFNEHKYCSLRIADNGTYVYQFESILTDQQKKDSVRV